MEIAHFTGFFKWAPCTFFGPQFVLSNYEKLLVLRSRSDTYNVFANCNNRQYIELAKIAIEKFYSSLIEVEPRITTINAKLVNSSPNFFLPFLSYLVCRAVVRMRLLVNHVFCLLGIDQ